MFGNICANLIFQLEVNKMHTHAIAQLFNPEHHRFYPALQPRTNAFLIILKETITLEDFIDTLGTCPGLNQPQNILTLVLIKNNSNPGPSLTSHPLVCKLNLIQEHFYNLPELFQSHSHYIHLAPYSVDEQYAFMAMAMGLKTEALNPSPKLEACLLACHGTLIHSITAYTAKTHNIQKKDVRECFLKHFEIPNFSKQNIDELNVFTIYYWGRSGSLFLQSLFDRHPGVLSTPGTILMYFFMQWDMILHHIPTATMSLNSVLDAVIDYYDPLFKIDKDPTENGLDTLGDDKNQGINIDPHQVKNCFCLLLKTFFPPETQMSRALFFKLFHFAYEMAQGVDITYKKWICFHLHMAKNPSLPQLLQDFPKLEGIGIAREPMRSFYSHLGRESKILSGPFLLNTVYTQKFVGLYQHMLEGWQPILDNELHPITELTLENLHESPRKALAPILKKLNLPWHPNLSKSTFNGLKFWGDKYTKNKINGFSSGHLDSDNWETAFSEFDKRVLYLLKYKEVMRLGYEKQPTYLRSLLPLFLLVPTRLERQAFEQALKEHNEAHVKQTILCYLARLYVVFEFYFKTPLHAGDDLQNMSRSQN